jgi:hypothetical protein
MNLILSDLLKEPILCNGKLNSSFKRPNILNIENSSKNIALVGI